jgi:DNA-binding beta-propeller fold protein YncE
MAVFLFLILALWWTPAAAADSVLEVRLETADIVYDPGRDRIYASIPGSALSGPNRVVRINPATGAVEAGVNVLTNPGKLAISDDGQFLYVAVTNGTAVQRITLRH